MTNPVADGPGEGPERPRSVWDALRDNPGWRRLYVARTASLLGNWLNTLAIVHLLGERSDGSALAFALVFVLKQVPTFVLGPMAGVLADRLDRKRLMVVCDLLDAALALAFLVGASLGVGAIYVLAGLQIAVATVFEPARQAAVPNLVQPRDLVPANALSSVTWSIAFAVGTAAGGVVLAFLGWRAAMVIDAVSYLVSALLIASIHIPPVERARSSERPGWRRLTGLDDVVDGLRYIVREPMVRHLILVKATWGFMGAATLFLTLLGMWPVYRIGGSDDLGIAALWAARAVGTGIGPFLARAYAGDDPVRLRRTIAVGYVLGLLGYGAVPLWMIPEVTIPLVVFAHVGGSIVWVMSTVLLQMTVPDALRGRTFAAELGLVMLANSVVNVAYAIVLDAGVSLPATIWVAVGVFTLASAKWIVEERRLQRG